MRRCEEGVTPRLLLRVLLLVLVMQKAQVAVEEGIGTQQATRTREQDQLVMMKRWHQRAAAVVWRFPPSTSCLWHLPSISI